MLHWLKAWTPQLKPATLPSPPGDTPRYRNGLPHGRKHLAFGQRFNKTSAVWKGVQPKWQISIGFIQTHCVWMDWIRHFRKLGPMQWFSIHLIFWDYITGLQLNNSSWTTLYKKWIYIKIFINSNQSEVHIFFRCFYCMVRSVNAVPVAWQWPRTLEIQDGYPAGPAPRSTIPTF